MEAAAGSVWSVASEDSDGFVDDGGRCHCSVNDGDDAWWGCYVTSGGRAGGAWEAFPWQFCGCIAAMVDDVDEWGLWRCLNDEGDARRLTWWRYGSSRGWWRRQWLWLKMKLVQRCWFVGCLVQFVVREVLPVVAVDNHGGCGFDAWTVALEHGSEGYMVAVEDCEAWTCPWWSSWWRLELHIGWFRGGLNVGNLACGGKGGRCDGGRSTGMTKVHGDWWHWCWGLRWLAQWLFGGVSGTMIGGDGQFCGVLEVRGEDQWNAVKGGCMWWLSCCFCRASWWWYECLVLSWRNWSFLLLQAAMEVRGGCPGGMARGWRWRGWCLGCCWLW